MAEIHQPSPLKPTWPVRPDEQSANRKRQKKKQEKDSRPEPAKPGSDRGSGKGGGIDEYA